jgi:hypothetical protein
VLSGARYSAIGSMFSSCLVYLQETSNASGFCVGLAWGYLVLDRSCLAWLGVGHAIRHPNTSMRCSTTSVGTSEFRYDSALPNYPAQKHLCRFVSIRVPKPEPPTTKPRCQVPVRCQILCHFAHEDCEGMARIGSCAPAGALCVFDV